MPWAARRLRRALRQTSWLDETTGAVINVDDPENGFDIEIVGEEETNPRTGKTFPVLKFYPMQDPSFLLEDEEAQKRILKQVHENPLDSLIVYEDYDTIRAAMGHVQHGGGGADQPMRTRSERRGGGAPSGGRRRGAPAAGARPSRRRQTHPSRRESPALLPPMMMPSRKLSVMPNRPMVREIRAP